MNLYCFILIYMYIYIYVNYILFYKLNLPGDIYTIVSCVYRKEYLGFNLNYKSYV